MKLNVGCGSKKILGWNNIDADASVNPDTIMDLNKLPWPLQNNSVEEINCDNVLEHLHLPIEKVLSEMHRILIRNGEVHIITPNCFKIKSRLHFLLGEFKDSDGWSINHTLIIKPSILREIARHKGFAVYPEPDFFEDLFAQEIKFTLRKREDV